MIGMPEKIEINMKKKVCALLHAPTSLEACRCMYQGTFEASRCNIGSLSVPVVFAVLLQYI